MKRKEILIIKFRLKKKKKKWKSLHFDGLLILFLRIFDTFQKIFSLIYFFFFSIINNKKFEKIKFHQEKKKKPSFSDTTITSMVTVRQFFSLFFHKYFVFNFSHFNFHVLLLFFSFVIMFVMNCHFTYHFFYCEAKY